MATLYPSDVDELHGIFAGEKGAKKQPTLVARFTAWMRANRTRRADAEIGAFIEAHGGVLTDDLERQISRQFGGPAGQA